MPTVLTSEQVTDGARAYFHLTTLEAALRGEYLPSRIPHFRGVTDDGRAIFAYTLDAEPDTIALLSSREVKNFLSNLRAVKATYGPVYAKTAQREFRNAQWALVMGAKPNMPLTEYARRSNPALTSQIF